MKYIVDASVLLMVGRGEWPKIHVLAMHRKPELAVPEPVVVQTAMEVRAIPKPEALRRWTLLVAEMPRVPWTKAVSEKLLGFEPLSMSLEAVTAAYALAHDATVLTTERRRYEGIAGLRIDEI